MVNVLICLEQYPAFTNVRLYHEVYNKRLQFLCEFSSDDNNNNDTFEVTWYQSTPVKQLNQINILRGKERMAILRNNHSYPNQPIFHLGTTVSYRPFEFFYYLLFYAFVTTWTFSTTSKTLLVSVRLISEGCLVVPRSMRTCN